MGFQGISYLLSAASISGRYLDFSRGRSRELLVRPMISFVALAGNLPRDSPTLLEVHNFVIIEHLLALFCNAKFLILAPSVYESQLQLVN
jgi:hypothetical protein